MSETPDWVKLGRGLRPELRWSRSLDAPLAALDLAREAGDVFAADASGGVYVINRRGNIAALTRAFDRVRLLACSDTGSRFAAVMGERTLNLIDRKLKPEWSLEMPDAIVALAITSHGRYLAASLAGGQVIIFDEKRRQEARFETPRPLRFLQFLTSSPLLIGAAEFGLLGLYQLDGTELWSSLLWGNAGDLSATGDGSLILLASFSHGVQLFDRSGEVSGSYIVEGTPDHLSTSFEPRRVAISTIERHLYWVDGDGAMVWATLAPETVHTLRCDPLGSGMVCGLASGTIVRLDWKI